LESNRLLINDYEHYVFPLPVKHLLGKKRSRYIINQLEQRHPCYTQNFDYDSFLRISKRGFLSDVIVMDKMKLSEYRNKLNWWNAGFRIEGSRKLRFISGKITLIYKLGIMILFFLVLVLLGYGLKQKKIRTEKIVPAEENAIIDYGITAENKIQRFFPAGETGTSLLETISKQNGKLSDFSWKIDRYEERITATVKQIFPEGVNDFNVSPEITSVNYESGYPVFKISLHNAVDFFTTSAMEQKENDFEKNIRDILLKKKLTLIEEKYRPYKCKVMVNTDYSFFLDIDDYCKDNNLGISEININTVNENANQVDICFTNTLDYKNGLSAGSIYKYADVFKSETNNLQRILKAKKSMEKGTHKDLTEDLKMIGEVKYQDGKSLIFYTDKHGKIIKQIKGE